MAPTTRALMLAVATAGSAALVWRARRIRHRTTWPKLTDGGPDRWHVVTIALPIDQVTPNGRPPGPLAELGSDVEIQIRSAPGDRGTEVAVRGKDARALRRALRETRSLLETGEVLLPDAPATTEPTLLSRPLDHVIRHGREEGRL